MIDLCSGETKYRNNDPLKWQHPFRCSISGSSGSGKTMFLLNKLQNSKNIFNKIIWCAPSYSLAQPKLENFAYNFGKNNVIFIEGLNTEKIDEYLNNFCQGQLQTCLVLDDLMYSQNTYINNLFTSGRHKNCSIIELTQRIFNSTKSRTNRLNTNYFCIGPFGDMQEFTTLARQINPIKYKQILEAYKHITSEKYHFLIIDLNTHILTVKNKDYLKFRDTNWDECIISLSKL